MSLFLSWPSLSSSWLPFIKHFLCARQCCVHYLNHHNNHMRSYYFPILQMRNWGSEKLNFFLPRGQLESGRARIWTMCTGLLFYCSNFMPTLYGPDSITLTKLKPKINLCLPKGGSRKLLVFFLYDHLTYSW